MTLQRLLIINVATLESHVATFQRFKNQRRDVGNPRRDIPETLKINVATFESHGDVPEKGKIDVTTLKRRDVGTSLRCDPTSRRDREGF